MSAQEDERRRIARDLHDEIGQALTSLLIGLRTVADAATVEMAHERAHGVRVEVEAPDATGVPLPEEARPPCIELRKRR